ncbi:MAG TPA: response regulator [Candidatus Acidoferrum sp.]|jgi:two-component system cell cycle sensor histidine kinase/response regulator CckA|nr:response regulator [Candidatus Acidoferrum sp.]
MQSCIGRGTILIVEDEQVMLRVVEKVLLQHGYQVLVASDGEEAIEVYRRHKLEIDVVLLDVDLPKLTGWDVLLKMKEENPDVRVVIATGFLEPKMKTEMSRVTVKHFVDKPYMLDEVVETLQSLIDAPVASSGSNTPVT